MELLAIRTARFIGNISTAELNPRGRYVYPALIQGIAEKYNFAVVPDQEKGFDEGKGIIFEDGAWNDIAIDKVTIFADGLVIDTRSSTKDSEAIFGEALAWASNTFGLTYKPSMVSRKMYVSEIVIRSNASLNLVNPKFEAFTNKLSALVNKYSGFKREHELVVLGFHYDPFDKAIVQTGFRIERLLGVDFESGKYYCAAPLPTEDHIAMLQEFESILI